MLFVNFESSNHRMVPMILMNEVMEIFGITEKWFSKSP
jgi:hypothetical protein